MWAYSQARLSDQQREQAVMVQWDPERDVELRRLPWRSVQIGIGRGVCAEWIQDMILRIEVRTEPDSGDIRPRPRKLICD